MCVPPPLPQVSKNMNVWANVKNYELLSFFISTYDPEKDKDVDELPVLGPNDQLQNAIIMCCVPEVNGHDIDWIFTVCISGCYGPTVGG